MGPAEIKYESLSAEVIKQAEEQKEKLIENALQYGGVFFVILSVLGIILQSVFLVCIGAFIFAVAVPAVVSSLQSSRLLTFKAGLVGESVLKDALREVLSSDYTVYYNFPTPYGDIDALVVGPTGVYVVEVKHYNGYIRVGKNGWERFKVGRNGTVYTVLVGNPEVQAKRNALYIKGLLKQKGIDVWVEYAVVLTNPTVKIKLEKEANVFHISEIRKLFLDKGVLSDKQIKEINSLCNLHKGFNNM